MAQLEKERSLELAVLTRQQQQELGALTRERDLRLGRLERDITQQQQLYAELATNTNQATLAKAQQDVEDVRLGAPAVVINRPEPRGTLIKALVGLFVGGLIGLLVAIAREAFAQVEHVV